MIKNQPLSAKLGEIRFREKLVRQHQGERVFYPTHTNATENLKILKKRARNTALIFEKLKRQKILLSPFVEIGGEKCERAAVLSSTMNCQGAVLDLSAKSLESAANFCPQIGLSRLPVRICADACHLPFADNSLVFAFTFQTLHHFPDPEPILKEVYRVLSPGGYFYLDEEPVKQRVNLSLWRRDYHLRWWEKILKVFLVLPFISTIGKSEVSEGVLEGAFNFSTWERALNQFDQVSVELVPFPLGPKETIKKSGRNWLCTNSLAKTIINFSGGGLRALCQKAGTVKSYPQNLFSFLICPEDGARIKKVKSYFLCPKCQAKYPIKDEVIYLLPGKLKERLYP